jgi:hypothetical protein
MHTIQSVDCPWLLVDAFIPARCFVRMPYTGHLPRLGQVLSTADVSECVFYAGTDVDE